MRILVDREQLAWAAGFFDGEGSTFLNTSGSWRYGYPTVSIAQVNREPLDKFQSIVGVGKVRGPYKGSSRTSYYRYESVNYETVQHILAVLWTHLSFEKKRQAVSVLSRARNTEMYKSFVKLGPALADKIRQMLSTGAHTQTELARRFSVSASAVSRIATGRSYGQ